jgi:hypothetical protein
LKNALRMRPDRIIIGECRGEEALDMLQAMNTGHDGSMSTIHANSPREALTRLENMIGMAGINLPSRAVRTQIASAIHMIAQVNRMRDGQRRVTHLMEVVGMEGDIITTQELFTYQFQGEGSDGKLRGNFQSSGIRPTFLPRAEYFGLDRTLLEVDLSWPLGLSSCQAVGEAGRPAVKIRPPVQLPVKAGVHRSAISSSSSSSPRPSSSWPMRDDDKTVRVPPATADVAACRPRVRYRPSPETVAAVSR